MAVTEMLTALQCNGEGHVWNYRVGVSVFFVIEPLQEGEEGS